MYVVHCPFVSKCRIRRQVRQVIVRGWISVCPEALGARMPSLNIRPAMGVWGFLPRHSITFFQLLRLCSPDSKLCTLAVRSSMVFTLIAIDCSGAISSDNAASWVVPAEDSIDNDKEVRSRMKTSYKPFVQSRWYTGNSFILAKLFSSDLDSHDSAMAVSFGTPLPWRYMRPKKYWPI